MDDITTPVPVERTGPAPLARIGLVGAAAAALVAVGMLAAGASAAPSGTLAAGTAVDGTNAGATTTTIDLPAGAPPGWEMGGRFGGPHGFQDITITAISGSRISLATTDGWTRTITVDSGTTYTKSGNSITLSDLALGDEIRFQQTLETDGTWSIDAIAVIPPRLGGAVTAISGSTITVEGQDGATGTITVTGSTTFQVAGNDTAALADVKVGMFLVAEGTANGDGSLTATAVHAADSGSMPGPGVRGMHGFDGMHGLDGLHGFDGLHGPGDLDGDGTVPGATSAPDSTSGSAG